MISKQAEAFHDKFRAMAAAAAEAPPPEPNAPLDTAGIRAAFSALSSSLGKPLPHTKEEIKANGVRAVWFTPEGVTGATVVLYLHGGAYVACSPESHANIIMHLAKRFNGRALAVDYGLTPENLFPTQIEQCVAVYKWLLDQGTKPENILFAGESAGGSLCITTQLLAKQQGLPMPAAAFPMSPWLDFEATGESYDTVTADLSGSREGTEMWGALYLGPKQKVDHDNPLICPLHASLKGLAPMFVQVGGDEKLSDDSRNLVKNAKRDGVEAELDVVPEMQHMFQMNIGDMPEAEAGLDRALAWLKTYVK